MPAILEFRDNRTQHDDIFFSFEGIEKTCDSYYLALDYSLRRGDESPDKVRLVLQRLLGQWRGAIQSTTDGCSVYLPYDFSDEWTGCLRCTRNGTKIVVTDGWSEIGAWSVLPSSPGNYLITNSSFKVAGGEAVEVPVSTFLEKIGEAISMAKPPSAEQADGDQPATRDRVNA